MKRRWSVLFFGIFGILNAVEWQQNDLIFNPTGVPSLAFSQPRFADLDADGDPDLILGSLSGSPVYLENVGSASQPAFRMDESLLAGVNSLHAEMAECTDWDGDGDLDLLTGGFTGVHVYINIGTPESPHFQYGECLLTSEDIGETPVPTSGDLDGDGDPDLVVGLSESGLVKYFQNTGEPGIAQFHADAALTFTDAGLYAYPHLADLEGDGDLDLLIGRDEHGFLYYENIGDSLNYNWQDRSSLFTAPGTATYWNSPTLTDLNGDGKPDLIYGTSEGPLKYYRNAGTAVSPVWTANTTLFEGVLDAGGASSPWFIDFDGDGDLDLVSGSNLGDIKYFQNSGTAMQPAWRENSTYFSSIDHSIYSSICLGDLDGDGDADAVVGDLSGNLFYHRNTGSGFEFISEFFSGLSLEWTSVPRLVDLSGSPLPDLVVGAENGSLFYLENTGTAEAPAFTLIDSFFQGLDVGSYCSPTLGDLDGDGDADLIAGTIFRTVRYYENRDGNWVEDTTQLSGLTVGQNAAPALVDLDADGDLDLVVGNYEGTFNYFENVTVTGIEDEQTRAVAGEFRLKAFPNPFNSSVTIRYDIQLPGAADLQIFDVTGRKVYEQTLFHSHPGQFETAWNGRSSSGDVCPTGVYLLRIFQSDRNAGTARILLLK